METLLVLFCKFKLNTNSNLEHILQDFALVSGTVCISVCARERTSETESEPAVSDHFGDVHY